MSETKRNLVIRNGKYRLECINYEVTNVNFELMLYYDATNELIDKRWIHPAMLYSKFNPEKEYHIYTMENDITIRYLINIKPNSVIRPDFLSTSRSLCMNQYVSNYIVDSIDISIEVDPPLKFDRSLVLSANDIQSIIDRYGEYDVKSKTKSELMMDDVSVVQAMLNLNATKKISPRIYNSIEMGDLIRYLTNLNFEIADTIRSIKVKENERIRKTRDEYKENGVRTDILYSEYPIVDFTDQGSASYLRWEHDGHYAISAIKLG